MSRVKCPHCQQIILVEIERHGNKEMIQVLKPIPAPNVNITASDGFNSAEKGE